jgi:hypothetical protein
MCEKPLRFAPDEMRKRLKDAYDLASDMVATVQVLADDLQNAINEPVDIEAAQMLEEMATSLEAVAVMVGAAFKVARACWSMLALSLIPDDDDDDDDRNDEDEDE